jgi:tetratricopeptide (TPR) repeat protein
MLLAAVVAISTSAGALQVPLKPLAQVNAALQAGEADRALGLLKGLGPSDAGSAEARNLECRVRFTLEQWDVAASLCEEAVRLDGQNSSYHLWLGRALGEKANRASFLSAFSLGKRVQAEFAEAARLNPRSAEALASLGEFYYAAPGVVGGGMDKAESVAAQLDQVEPARAFDMRARMAVERKDFGTAERQFKQAIAVSAHPAYQWLALASFLRQRGRLSDMESAIHSALMAASRDPHAGLVLFDGASVLIAANRESALAEKMLEDYVASNSKVEDGPAFVAHVRLARLKQQRGDTAGAEQERAAALALAHDYKPAQDLRLQETRH